MQKQAQMTQIVNKEISYLMPCYFPKESANSGQPHKRYKNRWKQKNYPHPFTSSNSALLYI